MNKKKKKKQKKMECKASTSISISNSESFFVHIIGVLGLSIPLFISHHFFSSDLVSDPSFTLFFIWVIECPIVILLYSRYRQDREQCSYLKAVGRGLLGLPFGAIINVFGAIVLGAPIGVQYLTQTLNWSLMMSLFNIVPSACVFGSSWMDWQRLFAFTRPDGIIELMICLPAHGAIIGAWFGAWPMPLDWDQPWQEWPICVSYGAMLGYLTAMVASLALPFVRNSLQHVKRD